MDGWMSKWVDGWGNILIYVIYLQSLKNRLSCFVILSITLLVARFSKQSQFISISTMLLASQLLLLRCVWSEVYSDGLGVRIIFHLAVV